MKRWMIWVCMGFLACGAWGDDEYREFANAEGQTFRGKVLSFDAGKKIVQIEAENKKRAKVPLAALSEKDQTYVRAWNNAQDFMSSSRFRISAKRNRKENEAKSTKTHNTELSVRNVGFEITMENRSDAKLANIKVEYCIFYEQEDFVPSAGEMLSQPGVYYGTVDVDAVAARSDKVLNSAEVMVFKEELADGWGYRSGANNVKHGEVRGIWVRASMPLPSGELVVRDYCLPDSLPNSRTWAAKSVHVGLNK